MTKDSTGRRWAPPSQEQSKPIIRYKEGRFPPAVDRSRQPPAVPIWTPPRYVYRFLESRGHAEAFLRGDVWISTLDHIRNCDAARADPDEAKVKVEISQYYPGMPHAEIMEQRMKGFFKLGPGSVMVGCSFEHVHENAFILCTTRRSDAVLKQRFGEHCVRIEDPVRFTSLLLGAINLQVPLHEQATIGDMTYGGRKFKDHEGTIGHIAFMNVTGNADEQEVRMLWLPQDPATVEPILARCPEAGALCTLV